MQSSSVNKPKIPLLDIREVGFVKDLRHGIAKVGGLPSCVFGQMVEFSGKDKGIVMGFNPHEVNVIILGDEGNISVGDSVTSLSELLVVPVGYGFLGRIVNSLGLPLDNKGEVISNDFFPVFREAPGVMEREPVEEPMLTGIKIVDLTIPVGRGQRELIIGDRQTGKSSIGIDAIINQKGKDVICIYCWIGGPQATLKKLLAQLAAKDSLGYTIVVSASADTPAAEQYLAPYTASALGEYFMYNGGHVLVIFDDLTKHAWAYRQMSLLLERSPGREAYPGDIFFLHSQLLERGGKLKKERGSGSMTFLPIAETLQGDITGYIQTNLISITDGQLYINSTLFREGFKPAIDLGLSVSRIGSKVQCKAIRELSKGLRLEYSQYREMLRLTKLRTHLSAEAMKKMRRGEILHDIFMQSNNQPLSQEEEIILFYAYKSGALENIPASYLKRFMDGIFAYFKESRPSALEVLKVKQELTEEIKADMDSCFKAYVEEIEKSEKAAQTADNR